MPRASSTSILHALGTFFKGMPESQLQDLAPLVTNESDMWAEPGQRGAMQHGGVRNNVVGPMESASGGGADAMTAAYSNPTSGDANTEAYSRLSKQLLQQNRRIAALEKAGVAFAIYLAKSAGVPLPESLKAAAEAADKDETEEEKAERERRAEGDSKESKKAGMPTLDIPALLATVAGQSRGTGTPPDFSVRKSQGVDIDTLIAESDLGVSDEIGARTILSRLRAGQNFAGATLGVGDAASSFMRSRLGL